MIIDNSRTYFSWPVYGLTQSEKDKLFSDYLTCLTKHHYEKCSSYRSVLDAHQVDFGDGFQVERIPFLPVRLFKEYRLSSIADDDVYKVLTSSGTTSQLVSQIVLDRDTSVAQTKALVLIMQQFLGKSRLPMLIVDHPGVVKNRQTFSARGAGILGLSNFGRDHTYALRDEDMLPDIELINAFINRHKNERILIFGFTFMVWKYFYQMLESSDLRPKFDNAILIHSGGWKKLLDESVDNAVFKSKLKDAFNIHTVHNFYGMVEQVGSVFVECEYGRLHAPAFADVLIRDSRDWSVLPKGKTGLVQVLSLLPTSYPGHSLLTEDVGEIIGVDDCPCGRSGKTFFVHGRILKAELRGCSDTHSVSSES
jgi:phenylacetate-coenzyme A ligase PaaK-like adenylate-forming protein